MGMNFDELFVDNFAGGGGASTGIERALGRPVDIAINHNPVALAMHEINHPGTRHYCESVWDIDPRQVTHGRPVGGAWFSPDCRHFSKAKGGAPVSARVRGLAWVVLKWIGTVRPRVIYLENVEEFRTWGPLVPAADGQLYPCPKRKGHTFQSFKNAIERQGYQVEFRELRCSDYGVPTSRKRLFMIARCDGRPIVWPQPTHGPDRQPLRTAASDVIDWSLPCPSIFERKRPLAENTLKRIAEGLRRYVLENPQPFLIEIANYGGRPRASSIDLPLRTVTAHPKGGSYALCQAFMAKHYGGVVGQSIDLPVPTITSRGTQNQIVTSHLVKLRNNQFGQAVTDPLPTLTAGGGHVGEVRAFLMKYYSEGGQWQDLREPLHTLRTKASMGLVTVHGELHQIVDIGMRMLTPRELFRAQGFPDDYVIDRRPDGSPLTATDQVHMCGNSVPPRMAQILVEANQYADDLQKAA